MPGNYERDFYAWANEQAALLRAGEYSSADIANIAEEMGAAKSVSSSIGSPFSCRIF